MKLKFFPKRFSVLKTYGILFLMLSFLIRIIFLVWNFSEIDLSPFALIKTFVIGLFFDLGTISFFAIPYVLYLLLIPSKLHGSKFDRIVTYIGFSLGMMIFLFSFFAEITFWEEFKRRFNFIAVDYLIYTYEVVKNINESYPIPFLLSAILAILAIIVYFTNKKGVFKQSFLSETTLKEKLPTAFVIIIVALFFSFFVLNKNAEHSQNRYNNEISKTGIYSFFAAFRNNELSYVEFYKTIDVARAFTNVKQLLKEPNSNFVPSSNHSIFRTIKQQDSTKTEQKPNVIFICVESLSAEFLHSYGSELQITPNIDQLVEKSVTFTRLFATGTRTVRGMEAITLSIPPTQGRSIVKRQNNQGLYTIGEVFRQKGYDRNFFYGGDGYFDNMNTYFGGNGFNIVDRGRGFLIGDKNPAKRTNIDDHEVTFENAWGICDEDIYNKVIKEADLSHKSGKPFFDFVMTTSNHRPYTYPGNKIDIPSGTGRLGTVKYTDYAIGELIKKAQNKPWFKNTVFIIMADHCANSAGKWSLDVANYHIPALIYNLPNTNPQKITTQCSQIDLFPTLFGMLNWSYSSNFYGLDVLKMNPENERAFIGNYTHLGYLKKDKLLILNNQQRGDFYQWDKSTNNLKELPVHPVFQEEAISWYQSADWLYLNNQLKLK